jgi:hypothetical protein
MHRDGGIDSKNNEQINQRCYGEAEAPLALASIDPTPPVAQVRSAIEDWPTAIHEGRIASRLALGVAGCTTTTCPISAKQSACCAGCRRTSCQCRRDFCARSCPRCRSDGGHGAGVAVASQMPAVGSAYRNPASPRVRKSHMPFGASYRGMCRKVSAVLRPRRGAPEQRDRPMAADRRFGCSDDH